MCVCARWYVCVCAHVSVRVHSEGVVGSDLVAIKTCDIHVVEDLPMNPLTCGTISSDWRQPVTMPPSTCMNLVVEGGREEEHLEISAVPMEVGMQVTPVQQPVKEALEAWCSYLRCEVMRQRM